MRPRPRETDKQGFCYQGPDLKFKMSTGKEEPDKTKATDELVNISARPQREPSTAMGEEGGRSKVASTFGAEDESSERWGSRQVTVGQSDIGPIPDSAGSSLETGGMLIGPEHPVFHRKVGPSSRAGGDIRGPWLPPGAVPPGARFDPITPLAPYGGEDGEGGYPTGEPDFDELAPPGGPNVGPQAWRPPPKSSKQPDDPFGNKPKDPFRGRGFGGGSGPFNF